jgi:16S rRNA (adenine1518-N6/adenine1519-N6)-dimethyltransferase
MMNTKNFRLPDQNPTQIPNVRNLLRHYDIRPIKRLGQNFLVDQHALRKIIQAANLQKDETILEVGAGLGSLTQLLAQSVKEVMAIEFDKRLIPALRAVLQNSQNVRIIEADVLKLDIEELVNRSAYSVVANIPYYLTSALIRKLLEVPNRAERIVLTIQREVAERILAPPGKYGLLTLSVRMYGDPHIAGIIPASAFYPKPKVESAILSIQLQTSPRVHDELIPIVFKLAKAGFGQKRKQLRNSLSSGLGMNTEVVEQTLLSVGIDPKRRPQELSLEEWTALAEKIHQGSRAT